MTCMKYMPKHFWREYLCVLQGFLHVLISRPVRAHSLAETHSQLFQLCSLLQSCHSILEPCAEVIVSARQSILVSGGMMPVAKNRRRCGVGGPNIFFKDSRKNFGLSSNFSDDLFSNENCNKINT